MRAASGTGPVTVTVWPSASETVSTQGTPAVTAQEKSTGTARALSFSQAALARAKRSLGSGAFSGREPNIFGPRRPCQ